MRGARVQRLARAGLAVAAVAVPLAAFGGTAVSATAAQRAHTASAHTVALAANPTGLLKYTKSSVSVAPGSVTISFTNKSPVAHDVVLINSKNKILGKTPIFKGGTKSFTVTLSAGKYTYYCSVPGHRQAGMQGTLTVT
jgi:plastocyanin